MNQKKTVFLVATFGILLVLAVAWSQITYTIHPGEKGIIFRKFSGGLDKEQIYGQGFHLKLPWDDLYVYNVKIQESVGKMSVLSSNGLNIETELSYRYKPMESRIGYLHDEIGQEYHQNIIVPEIRNATRQVIGKYLPDELYSTKREVIQEEIEQLTSKALEEKDIILDVVLIRDIQLPQKLREAILRKLEQEQASLEYEFKLTRAKNEAERQRIEAEGKAAANLIISSSLTDKILKEKGIEATLELAKSGNSKVVVIGSGKDGLPLILGDK